MLKHLLHRIKSLRSKPLDQQLVIEFDSSEVRICVIESALDADWNQSFRWSNIRRVCFKDGGLLGSDILYISQKSPDKVIAIPLEAKNGSLLFGEICDRGLFPEKVWRRAMAETSGAMHCWPSE